MTAIKMPTSLPFGHADVLTAENLAKAIQRSIDRAGMSYDDARAMAEHMLNFFGYSDRIIDNVLEPEDRDIFYMMEDTGLLVTEREETTLYDGREWRIHYWLFKRNKILDILNSKPLDMDPDIEDFASLYEDVPQDVWYDRE